MLRRFFPSSNDQQKIRLRVAGWLKRWPWLAVLLQWGAAWVHGRFSIGAVGVLLDSEERVLLVEHVFHPKTPWGLPGGWVDRNELPQKAVEREFHEETGLVVQVIYPLSVWSSHLLRHHVDMAFAVELQPAQNIESLHLSDELLDYQWARRDQLPALFTEHLEAIDLAILRRRERQHTLNTSNRGVNVEENHVR